jgi:hypothetical protein
VHQVRHATEAADILHRDAAHTDAAHTVAHQPSECENDVHDADAPTVTGHFHDVEVPDCILCATHHTFTAVVLDEGSGLEPFVRSTDRSIEAHVSASPSLSIEIRGPPVWAA